MLIVEPGTTYPTNITLHTRTRREITNEQISEVTLQQISDARKMRDMYPRSTQRANPCNFYNCHGLVFASRRTRITEEKEIEIILREDNYTRVADEEVLAGDVVIYYQQGNPIHSGIVLEKITGIGLSSFKVVSKWGYFQEFIHMLNDCPYMEGSIVRFYRVMEHGYGQR